MELEQWIITIRLAHYKWLTTNIQSLKNNEKEMLLKLKQMLIEDGIAEQTIDQEILKYKKLSEEERKQEMIKKVQILVSLIINYLENSEEINSIDYPELYFRIQELLALNSDIANELIKESFNSENINYCMNCSNSLYGKPCTYYFSKKLSYK